MKKGKPEVSPQAKTTPKVKESVLGARVTVSKGETFFVEQTPACAKKLAKLGLDSFLE